MSHPWKCDDHRATLSVGDVYARIDLLRPWEGVDLAAGETLTGCRLFQIDPHERDAAEIVDNYVRGDDLVVTYGETKLRPVRRQVYWRALGQSLPAGAVAGIDLIVSMQTSLLDSDPTLHIASDLQFGATWRLEDVAKRAFHRLEPERTRTLDATNGTSLILHRPGDLDFSIAQCVHPTDFEQAQFAATETGGVQIAYRLFRPGLEKGVIRRGRLRFAILPRKRDEELAIAAYDDLAAATPPLTT